MNMEKTLTLTPRNCSAVSQCNNSGYELVKILSLPHNALKKVFCLIKNAVGTVMFEIKTNLIKMVNDDKNVAENLSAKSQNKTAQMADDATIGYQTDKEENSSDRKNIFDLNTLNSGESGLIVKVAGNGTLKKRLGEMGITTGQKITVIKAAPLNDPIQIKVRNYSLSLRRSEARNILITTD